MVVSETIAMTPLDGLLAALRLSLRLGRDAQGDAELLARVADLHGLDGVAEFAAGHHVDGLLLHGAARAAPGTVAAPLQALAAMLRERQATVVRRSMRQFAELRRLAASLGERRTPFLVLKGLPLAQRLYGDPFIREAADIDLLVAPEAFADAREAVLGTGFRAALTFPETPARLRWAQRVKKEETFVRRGIWLELHRRPLGNPYYLETPVAELYERRTTVAIGPDRYPTLGLEDDLVYMMCHGVGHGWQRLKWLCDVALCLERGDQSTLARAAERCDRAGISAVWGSSLAACRALGVVLPDAGATAGWRANAIARMLPEIWRTGRWPPFWRKVPLRAALKPNLRFAAHEFARLMVVPDDWKRVDLPDQLFFVYFLLRPWLWAKDVLQNARATPPRPRP